MIFLISIDFPLIFHRFSNDFLDFLGGAGGGAAPMESDDRSTAAAVRGLKNDEFRLKNDDL